METIKFESWRPVGVDRHRCGGGTFEVGLAAGKSTVTIVSTG
jgi:hypothetical protein